MKMRAWWLSVAAAALLLSACSMPQLGIGSQSASTGTTSGTVDSSVALSVVNDSARGMAVFNTVSGTQVDVRAPDPTDNQQVSCIQAVGYARVNQSGNSNDKPDSLLIVGKRGDGSPGIWEADKDGHVSLVADDNSDRPGDLSPAPGAGPFGLYRHLGWEYHATSISADGKVVVGYAENPRGYRFGPLTVAAGTTVGVYWKNVHGLRGHRWAFSGPFVLGSWEPAGDQSVRRHHDLRLSSLLAYLKLFFLNKLTSYLIMATAVTYDDTSGNYVVTGTDQDGIDSTATISPDGRIVIEEVVAPPTSSTRLVIQTFSPTAASSTAYAPNLPVIALFTSSGVDNSTNPWPSSEAGTGSVASDLTGTNTSPQAGWNQIDYQPGITLPSGTVLYVRISGYDAVLADTAGAAAWSGLYGIRVLTTPSSTYTPQAANYSDTPYDDPPGDNPPNYGAPPSNAPSITLDDLNGLSRYLGPADVDWVKITIP